MRNWFKTIVLSLLLLPMASGPVYAGFDYEAIGKLAPGEQYRQLSLLLLVSGGVEPELIALLKPLQAQQAGRDDGSSLKLEDYGTPLLSLENKLANTLGLSLGDVLGFDVNGTLIEFTLTSLRHVDWDNFNINFFTVVPPGVLEDKPASWVTSVYLDEVQRRQLGELVRTWPNVTLIDVDIIMKRVRGIMERVTLAVEFVFLFTILAGLAVLYAAIQANQDERRFESAVLRTLGARKKTLLLGLVAEFTTLGALSGLLAGLAATGLAWLLAETVFRFDYQPGAGVALAGIVAGTLIVVTAGMLGTRSVLTHPPVQTLREGAA